MTLVAIVLLPIKLLPWVHERTCLWYHRAGRTAMGAFIVRPRWWSSKFVHFELNVRPCGPDQEDNQEWPVITERGSRNGLRNKRPNGQRSVPSCKCAASTDPNIRLQAAEKWPVTAAVVSTNIWKSGLGSLAIARCESEGQLVFAVFLVDVHCLGVKNAFWKAGTQQDYDDLIRRMGETQKMTAIAPACLAKIVQGAVDYAGSFGLPPHPDFRHAAKLLAGIDPSACPEQFEFGRNGKPFYIQGPHESPAVAAAIMQRIQAAGGHFLIEASGADIVRELDQADLHLPDGFADEDDHDDHDDDDDDPNNAPNNEWA